MRMPHLPRQVRQRALVDDSALSPRAADRLDISRRTACRWRRARRLHGPAGLAPRSTRPVCSRQKIWGRRAVRAIVALRGRHPIMGARPLRVLLVREGAALSRGAVGRIVRHCLGRRREPRQALPRRGRSRQAVPPAVDPGRRRLGVHGRFERRCTEREPPLHVLPPGRPQWNGRVERCNDTLRLAFRALHVGELAAVAAPLAERQRWHNQERLLAALAALAALDMRSPCEHLALLESTPSSA